MYQDAGGLAVGDGGGVTPSLVPRPKEGTRLGVTRFHSP